MFQNAILRLQIPRACVRIVPVAICELEETELNKFARKHVCETFETRFQTPKATWVSPASRIRDRELGKNPERSVKNLACEGGQSLGPEPVITTKKRKERRSGGFRGRFCGFPIYRSGVCSPRFALSLWGAFVCIS